MNMALTVEQKAQLRELRKEVIANNHVLSADRISSIEKEVQRWACVQDLKKDSKFFEQFDLYDTQGQRTSVQTWRGLCHWLWLRHGCVHGMLFTPSKMVVLQRRAVSVADSPGYLDMTFAGHMGSHEWKTAMELEAKEEVGVDLFPTSGHVANSDDLQPIYHYNYVEPPRPNEDFYNVEIRYVFAIRVNSTALGIMQPLDQEVGSFLLATLEEAWTLLRAQDVASALRVSGPITLYHAMRKWDWSM